MYVLAFSNSGWPLAKEGVAAPAHVPLAYTLPSLPLDAKHHVLVHYKLRRDLHTQLLAIWR